MKKNIFYALVFLSCALSAEDTPEALQQRYNNIMRVFKEQRRAVKNKRRIIFIPATHMNPTSALNIENQNIPS